MLRLILSRVVWARYVYVSQAATKRCMYVPDAIRVFCTDGLQKEGFTLETCNSFCMSLAINTNEEEPRGD